MKLQVALDVATLDEAKRLIDQVADYADIIELGTSFIGTYGYGLVRTIREAYPELSILADVKIVDGGYGISKKVFDLGANYSTVVGNADLPTAYRKAARGGCRLCERAWGDGCRRVPEVCGCACPHRACALSCQAGDRRRHHAGASAYRGKVSARPYHRRWGNHARG